MRDNNKATTFLYKAEADGLQSLLLDLKDANDYQVDLEKLEVDEESCEEQ